jgi:HSP20 family molecular chaperone IbpA
MQRETYELMHDQVRAIYRALTGADLPELERTSPLPLGVHPDELLAHRFAELEAWTRTVPAVAARVPPFAFSPPVDVIEWNGELLIEIAVPSVSKSDVVAEIAGRMLIITGSRSGERAANGRVYRHAEIPRGPFRRAILLPLDVTGQPRVEVDNGIVRIHVTKPPTLAA